MRIKLKYSKVQIALEILSILILIGTYVYLLIRWKELPELVPGHYNAAGEIDRWGSKTELMALPILSTFLYALVTVVTHFPNIWNVPVGLTDANRDKVYGCIKDMILIMKAETMAIFFYLSYNGIEVKPLHPFFTVISITGILGTLGFFLIRLAVISKG